ncbi:MAG: caspase family protein [Ignavibacteria bacterium]|nr:caspase family protein [Ignavibacteria bacterium]
MKILIILITFLIVLPTSAQVTGSTPSGRLLPKKQIEKQTENPKGNSAPQIVIMEPSLNNLNEAELNQTSIIVRGRIVDNSQIISVMINNTKATLLNDNNFFATIPLSDGMNNIKVEAVNSAGIKGESVFRIINKVDSFAPTVTIVEPSVTRGIKVIRKSEVTVVKGYALDPSGVLEVKVNNQRASVSDNGEFSVELYLKMGDNPIVVQAIDSYFNTRTDTFTILRKLEDIITVGRYVALVIGINSYEGYWRPLKTAVNDATEIADILKSEYHFAEVHTLINEEATRRNIIEKFEWLTSNITPDDNLLIFYAGHGQFYKGLNKGYWVPYDAKTNSIADYISNNDVKTFLGGIPSKHTLLITDACFAGDIFRGGETEKIPFDPSDMSRYYKEVYRKPSRLAITSGGIEEVMDAGKENHSIFTYYLLKALKENPNKYMDASQLFNDFKVAVTNNSDQTPILQAVKETNDEGGMFIFVKRDE